MKFGDIWNLFANSRLSKFGMQPEVLSPQIRVNIGGILVIVVLGTLYDVKFKSLV